MLCSKCGEEINPARLIAMPNTKLCVTCKSQIESESTSPSKREKRKELVNKANKIISSRSLYKSIGNFKVLYKCVNCGYSLNSNPDFKCAYCNEKTEFTIVE